MNTSRTGLTAIVLAVGASLLTGGCDDLPPPKVSLVEGSYHAAWSPNSRELAAPDIGGIELIQADGSPPKLIGGPRPVGGGAVAWNEAGNELHYIARPEATQGNGPAAITMRPGGQVLNRAPLGTPIRAAAWAPTGWPLAFAPIISPREFRARRSDADSTAVLMALDGPMAQPRPIFNVPGTVFEPTFSPNGSRILFVLVRGSQISLWSVGSDGSRPQKLVSDLIDAYAAWSPNGREIAVLATTKSGDRRLHAYVLPAAGGQLRQLSPEEVFTATPAWTPDGNWITYSNYVGQIRRIHPDGSGAEVIAQFRDSEVDDLAWSPNGQHLAYTATPFVHGD